MKKVLSLVLVLVMCAAVFCGCSEKEKKAITNLNDLDGCIVAVQTATTSHDILNELVAEGKKIEIMPYEKVTQCFDDLTVGRADAVLVDSVVAAYYLTGDQKDKFEVAWTSEDGEPMGICLNKDSAELAAIIEAAIDTLYYDGTISELATKHFGNDFTAGLRDVKEAPAIDKVRARELTGGILKVGMEIGYPPMEYLASDGKTKLGFDVDIANEIGELLGIEVEFINTAWDGIFAGLEKGEYDCIISAVSITEERQAKYILTEPYVSNKQQIIVAK